MNSIMAILVACSEPTDNPKEVETETATRPTGETTDSETTETTTETDTGTPPVQPTSMTGTVEIQVTDPGTLEVLCDAVLEVEGDYAGACDDCDYAFTTMVVGEEVLEGICESTDYAYWLTGYGMTPEMSKDYGLNVVIGYASYFEGYTGTIYEDVLVTGYSIFDNFTFSPYRSNKWQTVETLHTNAGLDWAIDRTYVVSTTRLHPYCELSEVPKPITPNAGEYSAEETIECKENVYGPATQDKWVFQAKKDDVISVSVDTLDTASALDLTIEIGNPDQCTVVYSEWDFECSYSPDFGGCGTATFTVPEDQEYTLWVATKWGCYPSATEGKYQLTVDAGADPQLTLVADDENAWIGTQQKINATMNFH